MICSENLKNDLVSFGGRYLVEIQSKEKKRYSNDEIAAQINKNVDDLNAALKEIDVGTHKGWFNFGYSKSDSADITQKNREDFENKYVNKYLSIASTGPGVLMFSGHLKDKIGGLRKIEKGWT